MKSIYLATSRSVAQGRSSADTPRQYPAYLIGKHQAGVLSPESLPLCLHAFILVTPNTSEVTEI